MFEPRIRLCWVTSLAVCTEIGTGQIWSVNDTMQMIGFRAQASFLGGLGTATSLERGVLRFEGNGLRSSMQGSSCLGLDSLGEGDAILTSAVVTAGLLTAAQRQHENISFQLQAHQGTSDNPTLESRHSLVCSRALPFKHRRLSSQHHAAKRQKPAKMMQHCGMFVKMLLSCDENLMTRLIWWLFRLKGLRV